jgi:hypothetical protein
MVIKSNGSFFAKNIMEQTKLKFINGTARLIAIGKSVSDKEINLLVECVMDYMLSTGSSFISTENLKVDIDFIEAKIKRFRIYNGEGKKIDLKKYTQKFSDQLIRNQKEGMKRLYAELFVQKTSENTQKVLVFGRN